VLGSFNPGVQPHGTPIYAEVVREGGVELNVMWKDAHGRLVSSSWSKSLGWDLPNHPNDGNELLGRSARSVYIAQTARSDITAAINGIDAVSDGSNTGQFNAGPQIFIRDHGGTRSSMFENSNNIHISGGYFTALSTQQGYDGMNLESI
jgi:hypothetical protein